MAYLNTHKRLSNLPPTVEPDSVYFIRTGLGFDLYCTDSTGLVTTQINPSSMPASDILSALLTVDGNTSGLDADLLDGRQSTDYSWTTSNTETIFSQRNLTTLDKKYQFISCNSLQVVNLPNPTSMTNREFIITNEGIGTLELKEQNVALNLFIYTYGVVECHSNGVKWTIFVKY